jgi:hypothetical protein
MQIEMEIRPSTTLLFGNCEPIRDRDTGVQSRDKDTGMPLFRVNLMAFGADGRPDRLTVKVTGEPKGLSTGQPVRPTELVVSTWQMGERTGVSFKAASIVPANSAPNSKGAAA